MKSNPLGHAVFRFLIFAAVLLTAGCGSLLSVNVFVVGERTSLEKQVLGNYQSLSADFESFGSVRGIDEYGRIKIPPKITNSKHAAIQAMRDRAYNRDDVTAFLSQKLVGENNRGDLTVFNAAVASLPSERQAFLKTVVNEENHDRETLIKRLMQTTPDIKPGDEGRVRAVFASLNRDTAPAGARIQQEDGTWTVK